MDLDEPENEVNIELEDIKEKEKYISKKDLSSEKIQTENLNEKYGFKRSINIYNDITFKKNEKIRNKTYRIF